MRASIIEDASMGSDDDSVIINFQNHQRGEEYEKEYISAAASRAASTGRYSTRDILLDTGSTCSVFNNKQMLIDVKKNRTKMRAYSNGGHQDSSIKRGTARFLQGMVQPQLHAQHIIME